jgi:hypothetical protein
LRASLYPNGRGIDLAGPDSNPERVESGGSDMVGDIRTRYDMALEERRKEG